MLLLSAKCPRPPGRWETPYERRFGESFKGPITSFGAMVEYRPSSPKDQARAQSSAFVQYHPFQLHLLHRELQLDKLHQNDGPDIEPQDYSPIDYPVSKQLITLLRHGDLPREDDGAIDFWRLQDHLRNHFVQSQHWSDEKWKSTVAKVGGNKKRFKYCTDTSRQEILYLRALLGVTQGAMSLILHCRTMY